MRAHHEIGRTMKPTTARWIGLALLGCFASLGATGQSNEIAPPQSTPPQSTSRSTLVVAERADIDPLVLPDFSAFETAVADQLRGAFEAAAAAAADPQADDASIASIIGELARLLHAYELYDAAGPAYGIASTLEPQNAEWHYLRGHVARGAGDLEAAIAAWNKTREMIGTSANDPRLLTHLGRAHQARGDLATARSLLESALAESPGFPSAQASLGEIALAEGDSARAIELLGAALEAVPGANRLHYSLGMAYRKAGDLESARRHLAARGAVGLAVPDPRLAGLEALKTGERVHLLRGRQAFGAGRYEEAAVAFRTAAAADPKSARSRVNLAAALAALDDRAGAIAELRSALEIDPESETAHFNLGQMLVEDDPDESLHHLRLAADFAPADGTIHRVLAETLRSRGLHDEALEHYVEATSWSPDDEEAILGRASLMVELGRYAEATRGLADVQARMPWQGRITAVLARLLASSPDASVRDGQKALTLATQVYRATGRPEHARLVALALAELGRCDEAAKLLKPVFDALPEGHTLLPTLATEGRSYAAGPPCRPPVDASQP